LWFDDRPVVVCTQTARLARARGTLSVTLNALHTPAVGAVLERDVLARPEAWLKWKDFHMIVDQAERAAGGPS
jgi:hypothetical protein